MSAIDTVVIGAGHAGLAVSRLLADAGRDHVVLDRGRVAERWRTERWDSLRLLTPSWMTRLPGWDEPGPDPERYLSAFELIHLLERYAASFGAPVVTDAAVEEVAEARNGGSRCYRVVTSAGEWLARNVVIATGPGERPSVPPGLEGVETLPSSQYRNEAQLPPGGVLVVGASASGVQIADELNRAGRQVILAVGRHRRMPRRYRGMDIFWWLEATGRLARTIDDMPDPEAAHREPSMQLIGRVARDGDEAGLDLGVLQSRGVRLAGRLDGIARRRAHFRSDLADRVGESDATMHRFLDAVDEYVDRSGLSGEVWPSVRPAPIAASVTPTRVNLRAERIGTVVLATGQRPHYPWLRLPVLEPDGRIRNRRGVTASPGVYVVGQRFQHRRDSSFIDGARHDARLVVDHLLSRGTGADASTHHEAAS